MTLQLPPGSPRWLVLLADTALRTHIAAGTVALVSGATALCARKGGDLHRVAGNAYVIAMLTMAAVGAAVAPFLPQRPSVVAGALAFYLTATGWMTVRRQKAGGALAYAAILLALATAVLAARFAWEGLAGSASGELDGLPAVPLVVFAAVAAMGAGGDVRLIRHGGIAGAARIARHLWRMCFGMLLATISFFLGQQQAMPAVLQGSPVLFLLAASPLLALIYWLARVRLTGRYAGSG